MKMENEIRAFDFSPEFLFLREWLPNMNDFEQNFEEQGCRPWRCRGCHGTPRFFADYAHYITTDTPGFSDPALE